MNGHALRELAKAIAHVVHDGQSRQGAGEPYINHPTRMVESPRIWGWRQQTLCWLHDVVEDGHNSLALEEALRALFPEDIVDDVMMLSRLPGEYGVKQKYLAWIEEIAESGRQDVITVKLADLEDNLSDLKDIPGARSREIRYLRAKATLLEVHSADDS